MPGADARSRALARLEELQSKGASQQELDSAAESIVAEEFGPGPWSEEDGGPGFIGPGDTPPLPRPPATPPPADDGESRLSALGRGLGKAAEYVRGGVNSFLGGQVDAATWGYLGPESMLERARQNYFETARLAKSGMASANSLNQAKRDYEAAQADAKDSSDHPVPAVVGNVTGGMVSPGSMAAKGISSIPGASKGVAAVGKGVVSGAAGAAIDAGGRATLGNKDLSEVVDDAGLAGVLGGFAGGLLPAYNAALRDPLGRTGEYIQALERGRGFLNSAENAALKKDGPRAIGQLADIEGEKLGALQKGKFDAAKARLDAAEEALPASMDEPVDVSGVHARLDQSVRRYSNGRPAMPAVESTIEKDIKPNLQRVTAQEITPVRSKPQASGILGPDGEPIPGPPSKVIGFKPGEEVISPQATPADILLQRRMARKNAQHGMPATPENAPYREISSHLSEATHDPSLPNNIGGLLKQSDTAFAADMEKIAEGNELIFGKDTSRAITDNLAAKKAAASRLVQGLKDTQSGGGQLRNLEKIRELGPEYAESVDRVMAKIAEQGSKPGLPRVFSHTGKVPYQLIEQNAMWANTNLIEPMTRRPQVASGLGAALVPPLRDPLDAILQRKQTQKREGR